MRTLALILLGGGVTLVLLKVVLTGALLIFAALVAAMLAIRGER
jgi:hypothetical protein